MQGRTPRLRYHCVAVVPGPRSCAAARELKTLRLLSAEAPRLPLATCDCPGECQCKFRHFDDRRSGPRRAGERGRLANPWVNTDRRKMRGRRETDFS